MIGLMILYDIKVNVNEYYKEKVNGLILYSINFRSWSIDPTKLCSPNSPMGSARTKTQEVDCSRIISQDLTKSKPTAMTKRVKAKRTTKSFKNQRPKKNSLKTTTQTSPEISTRVTNQRMMGKAMPLNKNSSQEFSKRVKTTITKVWEQISRSCTTMTKYNINLIIIWTILKILGILMNWNSSFLCIWKNISKEDLISLEIILMCSWTIMNFLIWNYCLLNMHLRKRNYKNSINSWNRLKIKKKDLVFSIITTISQKFWKFLLNLMNQKLNIKFWVNFWKLLIYKNLKIEILLLIQFVD